MPNIDKLSRTDIDIVQAYADCDMVGQKAADKSHYTRAALRHHFDRVTKITGLDPRNFYQLHQLVEEISAWKGDAR